MPLSVGSKALIRRSCGTRLKAVAGAVPEKRSLSGNLRFLCVLAFLLTLSFKASIAAAAKSSICDQAAQRAANETGVPLSVLWSITRVETGRARQGRLEPWPWTVNMEGAGHWFETEDAARAYVFKHFKRGARSFDVGCFQVNYKWHGTAFQSIDQMFDPLENARYAAAFLQRLYRETGDWSAAAGNYHSRTPEYANRYRTRFDRIRSKHHELRTTRQAEARHKPMPDRRLVERQRTNRYPLLIRTGKTQAIGSLVPLGNTGSRALLQLNHVSEGS